MNHLRNGDDDDSGSVPQQQVLIITYTFMTAKRVMIVHTHTHWQHCRSYAVLRTHTQTQRISFLTIGIDMCMCVSCYYCRWSLNLCSVGHQCCYVKGFNLHARFLCCLCCARGFKNFTGFLAAQSNFKLLRLVVFLLLFLKHGYFFLA